MTIQYSKKEKKEIAKLRTKIHNYGPISTIKDMFVRSEEFGPDRIAVVEKIKKQDACYTVKEFHDKVRQVGTALYEIGLGGKHIAIVSENSYDWIVAYFSIVCGGGVAVPIDKELPDKDQLILVYCRSGRRSKNAANELATLGYTNIKEFGGINDWKYGTVTE